MRPARAARMIPVLMVVCLLTLPAPAQYSGGSGTAGDPYQIATAADLIALGETPDDYDKHFILTADIDLDPNLPGRKIFDRAVIAPDRDRVLGGFNGTSFTGTFDGNGHTISHLTIAGRAYLGLFGLLAEGGEVSELGLEAVDVNGIRDYVGGYCTYRYVGSLVGYNCGSITASYSAGSVSGTSDVGGLVGENGGSIATSYSTGTVTGDADVGGLVGDNRGSVTSSFWDMQTSGIAGSDGGIGLTTAEMQTAGTFLEAGWDFVGETANGMEDIWWILEGQDYPRLWWEAAGGGNSDF